VAEAADGRGYTNTGLRLYRPLSRCE